MTSDPRAELREIVGEIRAYLEAQREMGVEQVDVQWPESPVASPPLTLREVREELGECTRCKLHPHRTQIVFGVGDPKARLVFVGEAPGADEDAQGEPFVGRAGQLLTKIILAMGMQREDVYICNIIKCRPPGNRTPESEEDPGLLAVPAEAAPGHPAAVHLRPGRPRDPDAASDQGAHLAPPWEVLRLPGDPLAAHLPPGVPAAQPVREEDRLGGHEAPPARDGARHPAGHGNPATRQPGNRALRRLGTPSCLIAGLPSCP